VTVTKPDLTPRASRWPLVWIAVASLAPFLLAYLTFYFWAPEGRMNYGELIEPAHPLPDVPLALADGEPFRFNSLRGKWVLLIVAPGACDEPCRRGLYHLRQLRRAQGKNMDRIERVWLISDEARVDPALAQAFEGTRFVRGAGTALARVDAFTGAPSGTLYVVDPLGNPILRYPPDADPSRVLRDIARLLKVSQIG